MRHWCGLFVSAALAACTGNTIDAGGNDGAPDGPPASSDADAAAGPTIVASLIQLTPTDLVSDGTSLYWVSGVAVGGPVSSVPVGGGPIEAIVPGMIEGGFLASDDVNVYYFGAGGVDRAPKSGGGSPTLVNEPSDAGSPIVGTPTVLGGNLYWLEETGRDVLGPGSVGLALKSASLKGGPVTTMATFATRGLPNLPYDVLGVTSATVFLSGSGQMEVDSFPIGAGVPDGGMPVPVAGVSESCSRMVSDADAVYCETVGGSVLRLASDGTATVLGTVLAGGLVGAGLTFDDTYVYWLDSLPVGTVNRVPKTGGTSTVLAHDTSPVAIAVDANAVYWSDVAGNIMRLAK
ncbi:MAG TPA: hypothetical protein VE987_17045 [Polyangiaceae bacterium]|nr:hypothetical protein [Polyangiaceae bacterium]